MEQIKWADDCGFLAITFLTNSLCISIHSYCTSIFFQNDKIVLTEMTRKSFNNFEIEIERLNSIITVPA